MAMGSHRANPFWGLSSAFLAWAHVPRRPVPARQVGWHSVLCSRRLGVMAMVPVVLEIHVGSTIQRGAVG